MGKQSQPKSGVEPGGQKAAQETGEKSVVPAEPVPPNVYDDLKKMKPDTTEVSVRAEFSIGKDKVVVNTKDIQKGDFVFELTQRARIGTAFEFDGWVNDNFGASLPTKPADVKAWNLPPILEKPINVFMGSPVYVNGLLIDTKEKEYYFDVSMNFKEAEGGPFAFFGKITFDGIGLQIKHKGKPEEKKP